ncbi:hypothetical protein SAY86_011527 [Trapa natans]|uniref:Acid phosphatase/vanadium-dependent haloperoxidase-related protein n=1 Tax=Trapa natans TaxID=22666 RepID=A0AAN7LND4_TRANT|nr:hypothetical protein SAY86_011527 [Trapa natans]
MRPRPSDRRLPILQSSLPTSLCFPPSFFSLLPSSSSSLPPGIRIGDGIQEKMLGSGGMPSSHSATVMALAVSIGLQNGVGTSSFAIALVLACVVCIFARSSSYSCIAGFLMSLMLKASVSNFSNHRMHIALNK